LPQYKGVSPTPPAMPYFCFHILSPWMHKIIMLPKIVAVFELLIIGSLKKRSTCFNLRVAVVVVVVVVVVVIIIIIIIIIRIRIRIRIILMVMEAGIA
jgi:hypothetical protein